MFASTPKLTHIVVMIDATTKNTTNNGSALFKLNFSPLVLFCFCVISDNARVIGIIARVRVSLTVAALSSVWLPSPHILSHVAAAAVTDDVSLIAVPANIPNGSPLIVEKPRIFPSIGKIIAAMTLKKNITEIDCATMIIGSDWMPVASITFRFRPNPKNTTAVWRTYFDVKLIPSSYFSLLFHRTAIIMPNIIAIIGPPITGKWFPIISAGIAMIKHMMTPGILFLNIVVTKTISKFRKSNCLDVT